MTPINLKRVRTLDGESLFRTYWTELGSARSIKKLVMQLPVNPKTQKRYYPMGVWYRMYLWSIENMSLAYSIFSDAMRNQGDYHTETEWEIFVQNNLLTALKKNRRSFEKCLKANKRENLIY